MNIINICEVAFSTEWFLTIPGILITCGVILLIIALIMLLTSKGKGGNTRQDAMKQLNEMSANSMNAFGNGEILGDVNIPDTVVNVDNMTPIMGMENDTIMNSAVDNMASVTPNLPEIPTMDTSNVVNMGDVSSVNSSSFGNLNEMTSVHSIPDASMNFGTPIPTVDVPSVPFTSENEVVISTDEMQSSPSISQSNMNTFDQLSSVSPTPVVEESKPIYGGANPMDATQRLPKIEVTHEPYSGGKDVINSVPSMETVSAVNVSDNLTTPVVTPEISVEPVSAPTAERIPVGNDSTVSSEVTPVIPPIQATDVEQL